MKYNSPNALKSAFERRYRDNPRRLLILLMQRFAARVCHEIESAVVKGGLGLELRLDIPRTTKDADIIISSSHDLDERLKVAAAIDLGDFLQFRVRPEKSSAVFEAPGMEYHGKRYRVQAFFADRHILPGQKPDRKFTMEASIRSAAGFDIVESVWDGFEQVRAADIRIYSLPWQIAEKVHAYTDPRHRDSSNPDLMRPRDLLDLCRCAAADDLGTPLRLSELRSALTETFARRKALGSSQHDLPEALPPLPASWVDAFNKQVEQDRLPWATPEEAHALAARLIDPVLGEKETGSWNPESRLWE